MLSPARPSAFFFSRFSAILSGKFRTGSGRAGLYPTSMYSPSTSSGQGWGGFSPPSPVFAGAALAFPLAPLDSCLRRNDESGGRIAFVKSSLRQAQDERSLYLTSMDSPSTSSGQGWGGCFVLSLRQDQARGCLALLADSSFDRLRTNGVCCPHPIPALDSPVCTGAGSASAEMTNR